MNESDTNRITDETSMTISEVLTELQADFADISISKIRFLESRGLVTPDRAPSGYRQFGKEDLDQLRWILTMQRDHFLPLRVIKERIDSGKANFDDLGTDEAGTDTSSTSETPQLSANEPSAPSSQFTHFRRTHTSAQDHLSLSEFASKAELSNSQINELISFGLITVDRTDKGSGIERSQLRVARAAAICFEQGLQARHLKAWRVAAAREADLVEQIIAPHLHKGTPEDLAKAREIADALIDQGQVVREAIMVAQLQDLVMPPN